MGTARERAREARDLIRQGVDPVEQRKAARRELIAAQAKVMTFEAAASKFLAAKSIEFRNAKHAAQWGSTLATYAYPITTYAYPIIGKLGVAEIELAHVVNVLEPIWQTKTETAVRLRGRIEAVLDWATVSGFRKGDNPARWRGHLDAVLPKPGKVAKKAHHRALPIDAVPEFVQALRHRDGMAARALEFLILTAARSGEVRGARWSEIDRKAAVWVVPAERMKAEREHRVPLSGAALAVLAALPQSKTAGADDLIFPAAKGGRLSDMTISAVMRRMKVGAVPHGFRSTFRDWVAERTSFPHELAEMALAHVIKNKVEAAYRRGDMLAKRAKMMTAWAAFCLSAGRAGNVVEMRR